MAKTYFHKDIDKDDLIKLDEPTEVEKLNAALVAERLRGPVSPYDRLTLEIHERIKQMSLQEFQHLVSRLEVEDSYGHGPQIRFEIRMNRVYLPNEMYDRHLPRVTRLK